MCFVLVTLLVLVLRVCRHDTKQRVTFQKGEESDLVEIKTESYGAANYRNGGWCKDDVRGVKIKDNDKILKCGKVGWEKKEELIESTLSEKVKLTAESKQSKEDDEAMCKEKRANLVKEKAAMMAIKEQSAELERYEVSGPKSGVRNVFKKFPFLKFLGHEEQNLKNGSRLFEETSKPDFIDYGLPSYSEATLGVYSKKEAGEADENDDLE